jgi:hypothetical protein
LRFLLRRYDATQDWLVVSGSPYVSAAVFLLLGQAGFETVRVLRWDNRDRVYRPLFIEIPRVVRVA